LILPTANLVLGYFKTIQISGEFKLNAVHSLFELTWVKFKLVIDHALSLCFLRQKMASPLFCSLTAI